MNFNIDDPLADLLSDNSLDNDNFFDITNVGGSQKSTRATTKAKGKMEDLFGIQEETEADVKNMSPAGKSRSSSTPRIVKQKPSIMQDDADDDDLGFDPKAPKGGGKKDFLDLLGTIETKRPATAAPTSTRPSISRQSTDTTTENSNLLSSQPRPKTSGGRRSSSQSVVINTDPLGLFGKQDKDANATVSGMSTPISKRRAATADWLGLGVETTPTIATTTQVDRPETPQQLSTKPTTTAPTLTRENVEILHIPDTDETEEANTILASEERNTLKETEVQKTQKNSDTTAQSILMINSLNLESNNAFATLQQQESQLLLATQMKTQERALLEMQHKQETMLQRQERQFQTLLQQQLQRQQQMEENIKMQQQRINTHIQLMMTQPAIVGPTLPPVISTSELDPGEHEAPPVESQQQPKFMSSRENMLIQQFMQADCDVKRLELEKMRLEDLVANMKVNYEQEIEMIERLYKKQLKVFEDHEATIEERLKLENGDQKQYYVKKLMALEEEVQKLKSDYDAEIGTLKQDHEDELRKLRKSHENDIDMIKEEHRRMLDTVRQSKMLEFAAVQENGNYMETLREASNNLENLSGGLQELRDEMKGKLENLYRDREKKLEARERRVEDSERRIQIEEESAVEEHARLTGLVNKLDAKMERVSKNSAEEIWQLRQRSASLDAEKLALDRDKEYHREQVARDEKRIEELKTYHLAETERIVLELTEERNKIMIERTRMEMASKLHSQTDLEKERMEVEVQLKMANDSMRRADEERERFHKMQRELEQQKRALIDKEQMLNAKEDELSEEISSYRNVENRTLIAEKKARQSEQMFQTKVQMLNKRVRELSEKEEQLSQERLLFAQDRITLHNMKRQIGQSKCTLCKMSAESMELNQLMRRNNIIGDAAVQLGNYHDEGDINDNVDVLRYITKPMELGQGDIVDRMLDENINASLRRMRNTTGGSSTGGGNYWNISGLDDDSKKLAMDSTYRDDEDLN